MPRRSKKPEGVYAGDPEAKPQERVEETQAPAKKPGIWLVTLWFLEVDQDTLRDKTMVSTGLYKDESKAYFAMMNFVGQGFEVARGEATLRIPAHRILQATVRAG